MSIPFTYDRMAERFTRVRPWAKQVLGAETNRCAVCMGYTLQLTPAKAEGNATLMDIPGKEEDLKRASRIAGGPSGTDYPDLFFARASDLLPIVQRAFGPADVEGVGRDIWPQVHGRRGVLYIENCYPTAGDKILKARTFGVVTRTSGDHWDLFDGAIMVAQEDPVRGTAHPDKMFFWQARGG
ncbi:hypothetical protein [Roseomonas sp. BN140053]|uniref:hypothetical protein n=1 Tax=Roseomonas sp. BN140053 TaxID=3391898 RepID=UPI0039EB6474